MIWVVTIVVAAASTTVSVTSKACTNSSPVNNFGIVALKLVPSGIGIPLLEGAKNAPSTTVATKMSLFDPIDMRRGFSKVTFRIRTLFSSVADFMSKSKSSSLAESSAPGTILKSKYLAN